MLNVQGQQWVCPALLPAPSQAALHNDFNRKTISTSVMFPETRAWCRALFSKPSVLKTAPRTAQLLPPCYRVGNQGLGGQDAQIMCSVERAAVSREAGTTPHSQVSSQRPGEPAGPRHTHHHHPASRQYLRQPSPLGELPASSLHSSSLPAVTSEVPRVCQQQVQNPSQGPASYSVRALSLPHHCPFSGPPFMGSQSRWQWPHSCTEPTLHKAQASPETPTAGLRCK